MPFRIGDEVRLLPTELSDTHQHFRENYPCSPRGGYVVTNVVELSPNRWGLDFRPNRPLGNLDWQFFASRFELVAPDDDTPQEGTMPIFNVGDTVTWVDGPLGSSWQLYDRSRDTTHTVVRVIDNRIGGEPLPAHPQSVELEDGRVHWSDRFRLVDPSTVASMPMPTPARRLAVGDQARVLQVCNGLQVGAIVDVTYTSASYIEATGPRGGGPYGFDAGQLEFHASAEDAQALREAALPRAARRPADRYLRNESVRVLVERADEANVRAGDVGIVTNDHQLNGYVEAIFGRNSWSVSYENIEPVTEGRARPIAALRVGVVVEATCDAAGGNRHIRRGDVFTVNRVLSVQGAFETDANNRVGQGMYLHFRNFSIVEPLIPDLASENPIKVGDWVSPREGIVDPLLTTAFARVTSVNGQYVRVDNAQKGIRYDNLVVIENPYPVEVGQLVHFRGGYDTWEVESLEDGDIFLRLESNPGVYLADPVQIDDLDIIPMPEPPKPPTYYSNTDSMPQGGDVVRSGSETAVISETGRRNSTGAPGQNPYDALSFRAFNRRGETYSDRLSNTGYAFSMGSPEDVVLVLRDGVPFEVAGS